jgi:hypothetical protein
VRLLRYPKHQPRRARLKKKNEPEPPPKREPLTREGAAPARSTLAELKPASAPRPDLNAESVWKQVLANAQSQSDLAKLEHLSCESFDGRTARLVLDAQGVGMSGFLQTQTSWLSSLLERVAGRPVRVELTTPSHEMPVQIASPAEQISEASRIPIVRRAIDLFDATIVAVQSDEPATPNAAQRPEEPSRV